MSKVKAILWYLLHAIMCPIGALILRGKRRCGFLDLGQDVEVVGKAIKYEPPGGDGDFCFNIQVDPGYEWLLVYKGRDTSASNGYPGTLHCEFMPCSQLDLKLNAKLTALAAAIDAGQQPHVRIKGRWSFDGVHTANWGQDGLSAKEVWACIMGHAANEAQGWTEVHPAHELDLL